MTVSNTNLRSPATGGYACDGANQDFAGTFTIQAAEDVDVILRDADGAETTLTLTSDYTVTPTTDYQTDSFTVTTVATYDATYTITLIRGMARTQPNKISNSGRYNPAVVMSNDDRNLLLIQQNAEELNRCIKQDASDPTALDDAAYLAACIAAQTGAETAETGAETAETNAAASLASMQAAGYYLSEYASLDAAVTAIGATEAELIIDTDDTMTGNITVPDTLSLRFIRGNVITAGSNVLTINGAIIASVHSIINATGGTLSGVALVDDIYPEWFGAVGDGVTDDKDAITFAIGLASDSKCNVMLRPVVYKIDSRLTLQDNVTIVCDNKFKAELDFDGVLGVGSGEPYCMYGSGITNFTLDGVIISADVTSFTNDGFNTYGLYASGSDSITIKNCIVKDQEWGISLKIGCSNCKIIDTIAEDCYYHAISSRGTSGSPNVNIIFRDLTAFGNGSTEAEAAVSGINFEETYDSVMDSITCYNTIGGVRVENSCDNRISNITSYENWTTGFELYNLSQRNVLNNITVFDNNRANRDGTDTTERGNGNTKYSGMNIEALCHNNCISNVVAYQTSAAELPFTSGSDEPVLGSLLQGTTSAATGRVRKIEVTSGSWAGNDAEGTMYLVVTSGSFNASEVVKNITTYIPYTSGSEQPSAGDTIEGATSGATGTLLWVSEQSGSGFNWGNDNSEGFCYLVDVNGSFNSSEVLINTTTSESNFATTDGAETVIDTDILTTNGSFVESAGSDVGFQKYGIGINVRNLTGTGTASSYNILSNCQCLNNDLEDYEDRGLYNQASNINTTYRYLTRNA